MFNWNTPPCPFYGTCGGCQLQHLATQEYEQHKLSHVQAKLDQFGITTSMDPLVRLDPGQRRRVSFKVERAKVGFYAAKSHRLVSIDHCLLLTPKLNNLLSLLPQIFKSCPELPTKFTLTALDAANGIDLLLDGVDLLSFGYETQQGLADTLADKNIIRVRTKFKSRFELVGEKERPYLIYGDHKVPVSAGDFCQVSDETDKFFATVLDDCSPHLLRGPSLPIQQSCSSPRPRGTLRQADLFCGRGTLSLPMLKTGSVDAYEMEQGAIDTLKAFPINAIKRQLFKNPLTAEECGQYDRIVMNPPRDGAVHQTRELAKSTAQELIYISCNPATFARDASILIKDGYNLNKMIPFDQFIWSNHLELVGIFERSCSPA